MVTICEPSFPGVHRCTPNRPAVRRPMRSARFACFIKLVLELSGPVFRGHDTQRERLVAVKLFKLDLTPEKTHQLVAGLRAPCRREPCAHPSIATPAAAGVTDVSAHFGDGLRRCRFSRSRDARGRSLVGRRRALLVAARVAGALDRAYAAGFTHGCTTPARRVDGGPRNTRDRYRHRTTAGGSRCRCAGAGVPIRPPNESRRAVVGSARGCSASPLLSTSCCGDDV